MMTSTPDIHYHDRQADTDSIIFTEETGVMLTCFHSKLDYLTPPLDEAAL